MTDLDRLNEHARDQLRRSIREVLRNPRHTDTDTYLRHATDAIADYTIAKAAAIALKPNQEQTHAHP